ncbi:TRADD-N-associated membrane domain-containing protein [Streptomyces paradoxus]|uniref:TRADD-N-associated membrane domain-containing protein n=1 Tax=Streptomyces paradoxus TaxID=66375 RepID=UPI0037D2FF81
MSTDIPSQSAPSDEVTESQPNTPQTQTESTGTGITGGEIAAIFLLWLFGSAAFSKAGPHIDDGGPGFPPTWSDFQGGLWILLGICLHIFAFRLTRTAGIKADSPDQVRVQAAEQQLEASLARTEVTSEDITAQERARSSLALANLWSVTHARLSQYHGIALKQARKSFRNAQFAMLLGFGLLVTFTVMAIRAENTAASIAAATLGTVSAALAGFVGRTFIRSQEASAAHLQRYFDQPLELSRYLAAERLIADSELNGDQRAEVLVTVLQAMVAAPGQAQPGVATDPSQTGAPQP